MIQGKCVFICISPTIFIRFYKFVSMDFKKKTKGYDIEQSLGVRVLMLTVFFRREGQPRCHRRAVASGAAADETWKLGLPGARSKSGPERLLDALHHSWRAEQSPWSLSVTHQMLPPRLELFYPWANQPTRLRPLVTLSTG